MTRTKKRRWVATLLGALEIFIGIGGVPAGLIFILDPSGSGMGFSPALLEGTFLPNYLIPGLFPLVVKGLGSLVGGVFSFLRHRYAGEAGIALGTLLIGLVHWLQPLYFGLGVIEVILGLLVGFRQGPRTTPSSPYAHARSHRPHIIDDMRAAGIGADANGDMTGRRQQALRGADAPFLSAVSPDTSPAAPPP